MLSSLELLVLVFVLYIYKIGRTAVKCEKNGRDKRCLLSVFYHSPKICSACTGAGNCSYIQVDVVNSRHCWYRFRSVMLTRTGLTRTRTRTRTRHTRTRTSTRTWPTMSYKDLQITFNITGPTGCTMSKTVTIVTYNICNIKSQSIRTEMVKIIFESKSQLKCIESQ